MMKTPINSIGGKMSSAKAKAWVKKYQKENPNATLNGYLYGKDILQEMCQYVGSEGIWIFKGLNDEDKECFVLFPADAEGNVLENNSESKGKEDDNNPPANNGSPCPSMCPENV